MLIAFAFVAAYLVLTPVGSHFIEPTPKPSRAQSAPPTEPAPHTVASLRDTTVSTGAAEPR